jgi:PhnB protein
MPSINPYLNFSNTCEAAFEHYKSVFGGDFAAKLRFKDMPAEAKFPGSDNDLILHVALPIGKGNILMGSDSPEGCGEPLAVGNNVSIAVTPDDADDARRIFEGLSAGGTIIMPLQKTFWAALFGMCSDKFGIRWMVNYEEGKK